jgi:hypothetical protein
MKLLVSNQIWRSRESDLLLDISKLLGRRDQRPHDHVLSMSPRLFVTSWGRALLMQPVFDIHGRYEKIA